jgi:hypothetical protein
VRSWASAAVAGVALAALLAGCGPRYARTTLRDEEGVKAVLRAEVRGGEPVARGYAHPATIAGVRLAHILARIDVRLSAAEDESGERRPAIPTDLVYELGDLLSEALAKADPSQEVVIQALRKERRFGLFTQSYLTSFIAYVKGDELFVHLSRVDDLLSKGEEEEALREPVVGKEVMAFKVLPAEGVVPVGHQAVSIAWRNPVFRSPSTVRIGPGGKVMRRTILMETTAPEAAPAEQPDLALPDDPAVLRALADLEEERRSGAVTEQEYQERRRRILGGDAP